MDEKIKQLKERIGDEDPLDGEEGFATSDETYVGNITIKWGIRYVRWNVCGKYYNNMRDSLRQMKRMWEILQ